MGVNNFSSPSPSQTNAREKPPNAPSPHAVARQAATTTSEGMCEGGGVHVVLDMASELVALRLVHSHRLPQPLNLTQQHLGLGEEPAQHLRRRAGDDVCQDAVDLLGARRM